MSKSLIKRILRIALLVLIFIQVFKINKSHPSINPELDFYASHEIPSDVELLLKNACNDCHSHDVEYPWYTNVEPVSWWVKGHIKGGAQKLNFSTWNTYDARKRDHKISECIEVLEDKRMPLKSYTWMHPEAKLSQADRDKLIAFFKSIN